MEPAALQPDDHCPRRTGGPAYCGGHRGLYGENNHRDKLPLIRQSVIVALFASVITAVIFQLLFTNSGASRELLEGVTMLIAVVMLFFMSYWLLSKVEARHWKAWLEGKLSHSLSRGSLVGLWLTSFLGGLPRRGGDRAVLLRPDRGCE